MLKEIFDRTLAFVGLILCLPLIILIGLLIKIESPGPIFFKHRRVGKDGRLFGMYKFRKMLDSVNGGPQISPKHDPRLTKVGRVLERLKLDEIPQLINILKGDMSFVGPRPEVSEIVRLYTPTQRRVLNVKPGLVGPNQIVWRNEKNLLPDNVSDIEAYYIAHILPQKIARDLRYVDETNFWLDLKYFVLAFGATIFEPLKPVHFIRRQDEIFRLALDLGLCLLAFTTALLIKYDFHLQPRLLQHAMEILPILLLWQIPTFVCLGVYHQVWKYAGMEDVVAIAKAVTFATLLTSATIYALGHLPLPVSILILHAILGVGFLAGMRLAQHYVKRKIAGTKARADRKIVIYGANPEGELLVRRIFANLGPTGNPIGFLDADPTRRGGKIHGLEVLGDSYDLPLLKDLYSIDEIYITPDENSNGDLQHLLRLCDQLQLKFQFVATTFSKEMNGAAKSFSHPHPEVHAT